MSKRLHRCRQKLRIGGMQRSSVDERYDVSVWGAELSLGEVVTESCCWLGEGERHLLGKWAMFGLWE
jgi:hypothetical protein